MENRLRHKIVISSLLLFHLLNFQAARADLSKNLSSDCPIGMSLEADDQFDFERVHFQNTANWQSRAIIKFVTRGQYFNFVSCQQIGAPYSIETGAEFSPRFCKYLSQRWLPVTELEILNQSFMVHVLSKIEENEAGAERTIEFGKLLDDLGQQMMIFINAGYLYAAYARGGFSSKQGWAKKLVTRGTGWLTFFWIASNYLEKQEEEQTLDSQVRIIEIQRYMRERKVEEGEYLGPEAPSWSTERIYNTLKLALKDALWETRERLSCVEP